MRIVRTLVVIALMVGLTGCTQSDRRSSPTAGPKPTTAGCALASSERLATHTIEVGGQQRSYVVSLPEAYGAGRPLPVVMVLHGLGSTAEQILAYSRFPEAGQKDDFVVVAPQSNTARHSWNFVAGPRLPRSDARFIDSLAESLAADPCLDARRQYLTGMSNGAAMTFAMACFGSHDFAAYGAVAAAGYQDRCASAPPASFVYFHGTADRVVPIGGGDTPISPVEPVDTTLAKWAEHDGCAATPRIRTAADGVELRRWPGCDDGSRIDAYIVAGGGHTWPGSIPIPTLGATTDQIDATAIMTDFFGLNRS